MSRIGKIARLPSEVRGELNRHLREGVKARCLVEWLNALPQVKAVVREQFQGRPIREQNITEWRKGGYRDWLAQKVALEEGLQMCDQVTEMARSCNAPVTDKLVAFLKAHYVVALKKAVQRGAESGVDLKTLRSLCNDVVALRRGDQDAQRLDIERERLALDREHSLVRWRKKLRLQTDQFIPFLDQYNPAVKDAFSAFVREVNEVTQDCVDESKPVNHPPPTAPTEPTEEEMEPGTDPGKSD